MTVYCVYDQDGMAEYFGTLAEARSFADGREIEKLTVRREPAKAIVLRLLNEMGAWVAEREVVS